MSLKLADLERRKSTSDNRQLAGTFENRLGPKRTIVAAKLVQLQSAEPQLTDTPQLDCPSATIAGRGANNARMEPNLESRVALGSRICAKAFGQATAAEAVNRPGLCRPGGSDAYDQDHHHQLTNCLANAGGGLCRGSNVKRTKATVNTARKHRRRDSAAGGNFLTQLANHVILLIIISALHQNHNQQRTSADALKLPLFLSSWIPQTQQQQPTQHQNQPAAIGNQQKQQHLQQQQQHDDLVGEHSSNLLTFASLYGADRIAHKPPPTSGSHQTIVGASSLATVAPAQRQRTSAGSSLKRPFQSMLAAGGVGVGGKHPAGHLFSSLPKSIFGRILSSSSMSNSGPNAVLKQQQQQLQSLMASNHNKYQLASPDTILWPFVQQQQHQHQQHMQHLNKQVMLQNYNKPQQNQFHMVSHLRTASPGQLVAILMQPNDHPITSFQPAPAPALGGLGNNNKPNQLEHEHERGIVAEHQKKHALGYGEHDDDFIILNAQQVPELQQPRDPNAEEYREMPAIVISDHELVAAGPTAPSEPASLSPPGAPLIDSNSTTSQQLESAGFQSQRNVSLDAGNQDQFNDLAKLTANEQGGGGGIAGAPNTTHPEFDRDNQTQVANPTSGSSQRAEAGISLEPAASSNSTSLVEQHDMAPAQSANGAIRNLTTAPSYQHNRQQQTGPINDTFGQIQTSMLVDRHQQSASSNSDSPESNRQESAARAVVVPSVEQQLDQQVQSQLPGAQMGHQQQQHQHQEAMESFVLGPYKGLSLGDELIPQTQMEFMDQQPQQQHEPFIANNHNHYQQLRHSNGANLIGSASNLIQQARQLIQMPFAHLPHSTHFHQIQQKPHHQQQQHLFSYMPSFQNFRQPQASHMSPANGQQKASQPNHHYHHHWRHELMNTAARQPSYLASTGSNYHSIAGQPMSSNNYNNNNNKQSAFAMPAESPQKAPSAPYFLGATEEASNYAMGRNSQHPQAPFASSNSQILYRPNGYLATMMINHAAQQQPQPQQQYPWQEFGGQAQQPVQASQQQPHQAAASYQQVQLDSSQFVGEGQSPNTSVPTTTGKRLHKSGLYQIEPPKLAALEQSKLTPGEEDDDGGQELQQQKVELKETANELDDDSNGDNDDEDDNQQQQQHTSVPLSGSEPMSASNRSLIINQQPNGVAASSGNQILQVGASFGVSDNNKTAIAFNESLAHKGQVFNEPISSGSSNAQQQQQPVGAEHDLMAAELAPNNQNPQQQPETVAPANRYLNTQVYTLPYTTSINLDKANNFVAQPQVPRYMRPEVRLPAIGQYDNTQYNAQVEQQQLPSGWQMQSQQMTPITFITTSTTISDGGRGEQLARPVALGAGRSTFSSYGRGAVFSNNRQRPPQTRMMTSQSATHADEEQQAQALNELPSTRGDAGGYGSQAKQGQKQQQQQYFHYQPAVAGPSADSAGLHRANQQQPQSQQQQFQSAVQHEPAGDQQAPSGQNADFSSTVAASSVDSDSTISIDQQQQQQQQQLIPTRPQEISSVRPTSSPDDDTTSPSSAAVTPSGAITIDSSQEAQIGAGQQRVISAAAAAEHRAGTRTDVGGDDERHDERKSLSANQQQSGQASASSSSSPGQQQQVRSPSSFCSGRPAGLYADIEQRCKAYYQCAPTGHQMFRCNNQTQFNQKTQNCDWWYNVDCGGRLGSPEDFEQQTAASSPQTRVAAMEATETPTMGLMVTSTSPMSATSASASTGTTTTSTASTPTTSTSSSGGQDRQRQQQDEPRSFLDSPTSSTAPYTTSLPQVNSTGGEAQSGGVVGQALGQFDMNQQQFLETTGAIGNGGQAQPQAASSSNPTDRENSELGGEPQATSTSGSTTTAASYNNLIEVVANTMESQPRVGAAPNEEATTTTTTTTTTMGSTTAALAVTGGSTEAGVRRHSEPDSGGESMEAPGQQRRKQISQATGGGTESGAQEDGVTSKGSRRLVQSEFGGSSKNARAISTRANGRNDQDGSLRKQQQEQEHQQQQLMVGELSSLEGQLEHELKQEHHSIRLGKSHQHQNEAANHQYQPVEEARQERAAATATTLYLTGDSNQGSVNYDPQILTGQQNQNELADNQILVSPTKRRGTAAVETEHDRPAAARAPAIKLRTHQHRSQQEVRNPKLERRFGARLPAMAITGANEKAANAA